MDLILCHFNFKILKNVCEEQSIATKIRSTMKK